MIKSNCLVCGKEVVKSHKRKYCGQSCYGKAKQKKDERKCLICGITFVCFPKYKKQYCSTKCRGLAKTFHQKIEKECPICKKHFIIFPYKPKTYCSRECKNQALTGIIRREFKKRNCDSCGKEMLIDKRKKAQRYCSVECGLKYNIPLTELLMKEILTSLGLKENTHYKHQHWISNIQHRFFVDFFIYEKNIVIECDGNYWHNYPHGKIVDKIRTTELLSIGYKVLRFWESDIYHHKDMLLEKIKQTMEA